ncbi:MAG: NADPH:quinone reductase [Deltaproteobacteria bacterium]|nr:MAG: NADPH:quinone reductase [Deltaproteobacteria bacterium]
MRGFAITQSLPADASGCFVEVNLSTPCPGPMDLLVRIKGISINPVDIKRRRLYTPDQGPRFLGWDAAGVVEQVGSEVKDFREGDDVFYAGSLDREGSYVECQLVDSRLVAHKPASLDFEEAAALPLTSITAWESIFERLQITRGTEENAAILLLGGAGGMGSIAIQLLRRLTGLTIIATASREESTRWCLELGAHHVINHALPLPPQLRKLGMDQVKYILCLSEPVAHWHNICESLAPLGRICVLSDAGAPLDMNLLKWKSATFVWQFMSTLPMYASERMGEHGAILKKITRMTDQGLLRTTKLQSLGPMSVDSLARGHRFIETGHTIGKITLGGVSA